MATIQERLARDPEPWRPEPGDFIFGTVLEVTEREGQFGTYPVVVIETEDEREVEIHGFHYALRTDVYRHELQPGDKFGVRFLGDQTKKDGGKFKGYRTVALKPDKRFSAGGTGLQRPVPNTPDYEMFPDDESD